MLQNYQVIITIDGNNNSTIRYYSFIKNSDRGCDQEGLRFIKARKKAINTLERYLAYPSNHAPLN